MQTLPAEWSPQSAVLLTWPHRHGPLGRILQQVEQVFIQIARAVAAHERLIVSCLDDEHRAHVQTQLAVARVDLGQVHLAVAPSNDVWARDHGPITVLRDGQPLLLDFAFNGWGRKYPYDLDNALTRTLHQQQVFGTTPLESIALILEGGSIESDGRGTLLTTRHCLLNPQRNPEYDCVGLEGIFAQVFGSRRVLWLDHGELEGDDTDGHIDTLARFCDEHTIAYVRCDNPHDSHYAALLEMERELKAFRDNEGRPYRLVPLPLPSPKRNEHGQRLPATYANFLIINGAVLVPVYDDVLDTVALERLAPCFPGREIIAINCLPLIQQYGSLHCVTMQLPAGTL
ncbi:MAG: agmatine deiminase family protein [Pseudomonadota bacterium]